MGNKLAVAELPTVIKVANTLPAWLKRSEWKRLPFGAFADSVNERIEPSKAADEVYVGLEHLDPQDLHIQHWGKGSDVIGTKLRFRKGNLIFGRRRAYQRKLAVAEMDGICSAHAMVVRAKPNMVLREFLPFLMMSNRFMNRAMEISVGSLSPTINWTALKREQFDLPPSTSSGASRKSYGRWMLFWSIIRVRCSPELLPDYLSLYANSSRGRAYFRSRAKSSSGLNTINSTVVKEFLAPVAGVEQ